MKKYKRIIILSSLIIGLGLTLCYIFYTSTAMLTSDSVITDVVAHYQRVNKEFILHNWYYTNEFWFFSLTIPVYFLSFFIKSSLLVRQICVFITAIVFFVILYIYGKKFLDKKQTFFLLAIFLSGISYSVLDYFYSFNAYLTVIINSMFLLLLYYKAFVSNDNKKIYFILALVVSFLLSVGSLRYLPSVIVPFILTKSILVFIDNYKKSDIKKLKDKIMTKKMLILALVVLLSLLGFYYLSNTYLLQQRVVVGDSLELTSERLVSNFGAVIDSINNFFGFDNRNHYYTEMMGTQYMVAQSKFFYIYSLKGLLNFVKLVACILFIFVTPVVLFKNFKKNDPSIRFLALFNLISWAIMIYLYVFSNSFFHDYSELKYFLFNIVLNIILGLYCINKYFIGKNKVFKIIFDVFLMTYIFGNLYSTCGVVIEHNRQVMNKKYDLVDTLKKNHLTFGYGVFWDGILTNFLSEYKIEVASVNLGEEKIYPDRWASLSDWYEKDYHKGKTFLILNKNNRQNLSNYIDEYGKIDKILRCNGYIILVYNKNPFAKRLGE